MRRFLAYVLTAMTLAATANIAAAAEAIAVENPWVRVTFGQSTTTAGYVTLIDRTGKGDALIGVETASGAMAHIHESVTDGDVVKMRMVKKLTIPAGGKAELTPAGGHLMIMGLDRPLKAGETYTLKLTFEHAGEVTIDFPVRAQ